MNLFYDRICWDNGKISGFWWISCFWVSLTHKQYSKKIKNWFYFVGILKGVLVRHHLLNMFRKILFFIFLFSLSNIWKLFYNFQCLYNHNSLKFVKISIKKLFKSILNSTHKFPIKIQNFIDYHHQQQNPPKRNFIHKKPYFVATSNILCSLVINVVYKQINCFFENLDIKICGGILMKREKGEVLTFSKFLIKGRKVVKWMSILSYFYEVFKLYHKGIKSDSINDT